MKFHSFDNFYRYSTQILCTRFYYQSKKFTFKKSIFLAPLKTVTFRLTTRWSFKMIYFVWDFLRTVFYFQQFFLKQPNVKLHNSKYFELTLSFTAKNSELDSLINYLAKYKHKFPKLLTKNYLIPTNSYMLDFRDSQIQMTLPKGTIFDFYNWKNKVPIFVSPCVFPLKTKSSSSKFFYQFSRLYYFSLYHQLFFYKNFKNLCVICIHDLHVI